MITEIINEGPARVTSDNVQYWSKHAKALKHTQAHKAQQFIDYDCIRYVGDDTEFSSKYTFICLPLNPWEEIQLIGEDQKVRTFPKKAFPIYYNNNVYKIYKNDEGVFECNCQGWQTKAKRGEIGTDGCHCSHVLALFFAFKIQRFNKVHGAREEDLRPDMPEAKSE
jgi:hypothetical protein